MMDAKHRERRRTLSQTPDTWAEIFVQLDAAGVRDGLIVERDMRPAEERPALEAFMRSE